MNVVAYFRLMTCNLPEQINNQIPRVLIIVIIFNYKFVFQIYGSGTKTSRPTKRVSR